MKNKEKITWWDVIRYNCFPSQTDKIIHQLASLISQEVPGITKKYGTGVRLMGKPEAINRKLRISMDCADLFEKENLSLMILFLEFIFHLEFTEFATLYQSGQESRSFHTIQDQKVFVHIVVHKDHVIITW